VLVPPEELPRRQRREWTERQIARRDRSSAIDWRTAGSGPCRTAVPDIQNWSGAANQEAGIATPLIAEASANRLRSIHQHWRRSIDQRPS
jgi:hypothetical protein